jgi:amidophosphoribosyltransferase
MCGVFALYGHPDAARVTSVGLHALQHRGQESAGIASSAGGEVLLQRHMGHVVEVFDEATLAHLPGHMAIGHVRYSTTGASRLRNAQPLCLDTATGSLAIGHNGNLTNALPLRRELSAQGSLFSSGTDTEVILHLLARAPAGTLAERLLRIMPRLQGAYSMVLCDGHEVVAARDPYGWRPLVLGRKSGVWIVASETAALVLVGAEYVREVEPGEVIRLSPAGLTSLRSPEPMPERKPCVFEHVYFARPDSVVFGQTVYEVRKRLGAQLAIEHPVPDADVVIPVPDSGVSAALGYARQSGIPYELGLIRSHYVGRTFLQPTVALRETGVRRKLSPVREVVEGKRIVVIDDSLVRGTTSRQIIGLLREAGAREIHLRISSPPVAWPCWYGIDTPDRDQLIGANKSVRAIADFITADSLAYLSETGMVTAAGTAEGGKPGWCTACFSGQYPQPLQP